MFKKVKLILLILLIIFLPGFGIKWCQQQKLGSLMEPVTLNYWLAWDGPEAFAELRATYQQLHPNVSINFKKFRYEEFEDALFDAWATDSQNAPDIFSIHNTWIKKYQSYGDDRKGFLAPMPAQITLAYPFVQGTLKKETVWEKRTNNSPSLKDIKDKFVDVVYDDVVINVEGKDQVFGLPLFIDTLAMYYNRDLLNNANIIDPPTYWNTEFQQNVKKLSRQNTKGEIVQSGIALGGSDNIERFSDILAVLMMQNGAVMMNQNGSVLFHSIPSNFTGKNYNPGMEALRFYTDFANPAKEVYCWNNNLDNSIAMFTQGKVALMFAYAYHLPQIKAQGAKINFSVAKLPQIENNQIVNFANYWLPVVSRKSKHQNEAWDFIQFISRAENVKSYLDKTKKPTALRSLIEEQLDDLEIGEFADQVLTAKSWYKGADAIAAEEIIGEMIDSVVTGRDTIENAINIGASRVQQTVR